MAIREWRVTPDVKARLDALVIQLREVEEHTDDWYAISDEIRTLPDCPYGTNETSDTILVVCVLPPKVGYSGLH